MQKNMHEICKRICRKYVKICIKYALNMHKICNKICRKICKKYDKYAMWIYYGKYARKYAKYAKSADHAQKMQNMHSPPCWCGPGYHWQPGWLGASALAAWETQQGCHGQCYGAAKPAARLVGLDSWLRSITISLSPLAARGQAPDDWQSRAEGPAPGVAAASANWCCTVAILWNMRNMVKFASGEIPEILTG